MYSSTAANGFQNRSDYYFREESDRADTFTVSYDSAEEQTYRSNRSTDVVRNAYGRRAKIISNTGNGDSKKPVRIIYRFFKVSRTRLPITIYRTRYAGGLWHAVSRRRKRNGNKPRKKVVTLVYFCSECAFQNQYRLLFYRASKHGYLLSKYYAPPYDARSTNIA